MSTEELKRDCGCIIIKWDDDWGRSGQFIKKYCDQCKKDKESNNEEHKKIMGKLFDEYNINLSIELFEKIIETQKNKLKKEINEKQCTYNSHEIYCPCCNKIIQYNNFERHIKSSGHIKNLPKK